MAPDLSDCSLQEDMWVWWNWWMIEVDFFVVAFLRIQLGTCALMDEARCGHKSNFISIHNNLYWVEDTDQDTFGLNVVELQMTQILL